MKVTVDIPPDIEELLLKKCKEKGTTPSQFILALLEWYFLKKGYDKPWDIYEFLKYYGMRPLRIITGNYKVVIETSACNLRSRAPEVRIWIETLSKRRTILKLR